MREPWRGHSQHGRMTLWRHHLPDIYVCGALRGGACILDLAWGPCPDGPCSRARIVFRNRSRIYNHHMNAITMTPSCAFNCAVCLPTRTHIIAYTEHIDVANNCTVVFCTVVYRIFFQR
mgnify:CR=1 FL=1